MSDQHRDGFGTKGHALANARRLIVSDPASSIEQSREIIRVDPRCHEAHHLLGRALRQVGELDEARRAEDRAIQLSSHQPLMFQAIMSLSENRLDAAEQLLRPYIHENPEDPAALRLLAEIGARTGHFDAAEELLERALNLAPDYSSAHALLKATRRLRARMAQTDAASPDGARGALPVENMLEDESENDAVSDYREALELYEETVREFPDSPHNWVSYGHVLRTVGRREDAIAAYRHAIVIRPIFGEAWWALADLKTENFNQADIDAMLSLVDDPAADETDRVGIHFSLGKALEQRDLTEIAFDHYSAGNSLRAKSVGHDRDAVSRHVDQSIRVFDSDFFMTRAGQGYPSQDPIFIVGMPRSGSTLIEQILASHPQVEGTMELPDMGTLAKWLGDGKHAGFEDSAYLERLSALGGDELRKLGQSFIWSTGLRRRTSRPRFIDKMPNNWLHLGLVLSALPNCKIIDARRHPLACGLSNFKQHFARGQAFTYNMKDIGSFYVDYVRMMKHFDTIVPGRIHRVIYEDLVENSEAEVRRLLDYLDLPFDEACLRFHENRRAVRTSSSEQVRRPINREGIDQWRQFEQRLTPMKDALGDVLHRYPAVPANL
ncbi:MAG: sulfotransferase [Sphingosinicella sp.]|nr:sulfotransferase [Sphingosinicella sp.]